MQKIAFIFPGQGTQHVGMAKDFYDSFPVARQVFKEADDLLGRKLSELVFHGPEHVLTETKNSQSGIYVASIAILRVIQQLFPELKPKICAGLSLGEYTALTASERLPFSKGISLVSLRGEYMNEACQATQGSMAVILGLNGDVVEQVVAEIGLPDDIWTANFNCPQQVVISGTLKGIAIASEVLKARGAKRVIPLKVHGAFHSGLMQLAEERLRPHIEKVSLNPTPIEIVMNVTGSLACQPSEIRQNLIKQVTHPVRWEQSVRYMMSEDVDLFVELGCGKTLIGLNERIGVKAPSVNIQKISDIAHLEELLNMERV